MLLIISYTYFQLLILLSFCYSNSVRTWSCWDFKFEKILNLKLLVIISTSKHVEIKSYYPQKIIIKLQIELEITLFFKL